MLKLLSVHIFAQTTHSLAYQISDGMRYKENNFTDFISGLGCLPKLYKQSTQKMNAYYSLNSEFDTDNNDDDDRFTCGRHRFFPCFFLSGDRFADGSRSCLISVGRQ